MARYFCTAGLIDMEKKCRCGHDESEHSEDGCFHGAKEGSYRSFGACDCEFFEEKEDDEQMLCKNCLHDVEWNPFRKECLHVKVIDNFLNYTRGCNGDSFGHCTCEKPEFVRR